MNDGCCPFSGTPARRPPSLPTNDRIVGPDLGPCQDFPRVAAPGSGSTKLEWRVSKGLGTVYSTTVVYYKDEKPLNVALIDLDEGFRMMSRVEDIDPLEVKIGMRVKVRMHAGDEKQPPYPVFTPLGGGK